MNAPPWISIGFLAGMLFTFALYEYASDKEYECIAGEVREFVAGTDWRGRSIKSTDNTDHSDTSE